MERKSKRRLEMGEDEWAEYQTERKRIKARNHYEGKGKYATAWRVRVKEKLIAYKGGKCEQCGYDKVVPGAYDFHHKNPSEKNFGISSYKVLNLARLQKEADKCQLLCRNCHAEVHHILNQKKRQKLIDAHESWLESRLKDIECKQCNKIFHPKKKKQKYCSPKCGNLSRKVKRPSQKELTIILNNMSIEAAGRHYGVTGNAIRKWIR